MRGRTVKFKNGQCAATTAKGAQCSVGAMKDSRYCGPHTTQNQEETVTVPVSLLRECWKLAFVHDADLAQLIEHYAR